MVMAIMSAWAQKAVLTGKTRPLEHMKARSEGAVTGAQFMAMCDTIDFWPREKYIVNAVLSGNIPDSLRTLHQIEFTTAVVDSVEILRKPHKVQLWVSCDYLSIGNDNDFSRIPMGPLAAQEIVDSLGCILPTPFMVDRINDVAQGAIDIFPFRPVGDRNTKPMVFQDSNNAINALMKAKGYHWGMFVSGLKKDIVITCRFANEGYNHHVGIYGWHRPDGNRVQPCYVRHTNNYVDYSHGVRLVHRTAVVDGHEMDIKEILESPSLYRLLSNEPTPIAKATYAGDKPWNFNK